MNFDCSELADARLALLKSLVCTGEMSPEELKRKSHGSWATSIESLAVSNKTLANLQLQEANIISKIKDVEALLAPAKGQKAQELLAQKKVLKESLGKVTKQLEDETKRNKGHAKHELMWSTFATMKH